MIARRMLALLLALLLSPSVAAQDEGDPSGRRASGLLPVRITMADSPEDVEGGEAAPGRDLSTAVEVVLLLSFLTLVPSLLLTMTCFTRVVVVLSFVRRAMSTPELPPNPVLIGLALFISAAVMKPVAVDVYQQAVSPYMEGEKNFVECGEIASQRMKAFMLRSTRGEDLELFVGMEEGEVPEGPEDVALSAVIPAFVLSELKTAFTMGFVIYLPFLVVDLVVSAILLSMGMFMLPPMLIATPIKILLFVLVDGWTLVVSQLWLSLVT